MLSLTLVACGSDGEGKTTDTDTSADTQDTTAGSASDPTGTTNGDSTDGTATDTGGDTDATAGETTDDGDTTAPTTTAMGCENFLPPIMPESLEPVAIDTPIEVAFTVPGLEDNTFWELTFGELPPGVEFTAETGVLAGTPTVAGMFAFTLWARPAMDNPDCGTVPTTTDYVLVVTE
ncbi:hypothetical protein [Nannocystis radixulma]|uniref:Uncharacterized protein n=1 Tax=Nannocystis radixulma TaxID=2995305 RepID=A0ABT5B2U2_9BACT|nr:hypothetical protein [Nannocystis radixulma]MDC0668415.1 hypothetical protein [Nannocystis radixulma]